MLKTLIVDDEFFNRRLLRKLLEPYGLCTEATNGLEALREYRASIKTAPRFNLMLLDIMMPTMDGLEALAKIRILERENQIADNDQIKVIMVTTLADQDSVLAAKEFDVAGYILKPYNRKRLMDEIQACGITLPTGK